MDKRDRLLWVPFPTVFYLFVFQLPLTSHSSSCPCSLLWVFFGGVLSPGAGGRGRAVALLRSVPAPCGALWAPSHSLGSYTPTSLLFLQSRGGLAVIFLCSPL